MGDIVQRLQKSPDAASIFPGESGPTASLSSLSKFSLSVVTESGGCSPLPSEVPDANEALRKTTPAPV